MRLPFFKSKKFEPDFPIIPLFATQEEAIRLLNQVSEVLEVDPENDKTISQKLLVAQADETQITAGIWDGRVRFTNYLTEQFNANDDLKGKKLRWFVDYYGGAQEFDEPNDTGYMIFWWNPKKKLRIVFGLHLGPVRVIDEDPHHWPEPNNQEA